MKDPAEFFVKKNELRRLAETAALKHRADFEKAFNALAPEKAMLLLHELQVHQIELQMQNDELHKIQDELEVSRARYFDLYDQAPVGYCSLNTDGIIVEANFTAASLLGVARNTLMQRPLSDFVTKEYQDSYYHFRRKFNKKEIDLLSVLEKNESVELRMTRQPSTPFWARLEVRSVNGENGKKNYRVLINDISDRIRTDEENSNIERENQRSQRLESLSSLAAGIAHDFNNLLTGVFGNIELAQAEIGSSRGVEYLQAAMIALSKTRTLTGQLLTFAKGGAPIQKTGHLFPFVQESVLFALSGSKVVCKFNIESNLWPCSFDLNQIAQVMENIISNAVQAMPHGGEIELTAQNVSLNEILHGDLGAGNYVRISVKDSGGGIPAELLPRIFDPFFTTKPKNHGLGLATCYSIMKRHGGYIEAESEYGKGSAFHLYLPAVMEVVVISNGESVLQSGKGGTIVVMDDDAAIRRLAGPILKSLGYDAVICKDGQEAVDFFRTATQGNQKITALIFDLTIPGGMGGKDAVRQIRLIDANIPVFVCSGYADDPAMANPAAFGFTASIPKPFRMADISQLLRKYCGE
jgi:two-component system cell cycle sensor histidine kinase/response regulator CckA